MNIVITFKGMDSSDALRDYVNEKMSKYEELLIPATSISAELNEFKSSKGVKADFRFDITVSLPNAVVRVEEGGEDMYAVIDSATDILARRLKRYFDKRANWDGVTPWSDIEALQNELGVVEEEPETYLDYTPKVSLRKQIDYLSPMFESEAIERMELLGDKQILFKNSKTGKYTMIYKNPRGQYILVEPADTLE